MAQKKSPTAERKLALPLQFRMGNGSLVDDGFFVLTNKDVSKIVVKSMDSDGYLICELFEPKKEKPTLPSVEVESLLIGRRIPSHRGHGKEVGLYEYYETSNGELIAEISGKRKRRIHLGSFQNRTSKISIFLQTIAQHFRVGDEFDRKVLMKHLPKPLTFGQTMKSTLDILTIKGYLEKHEKQYKGRPYERYSPTSKIQKAPFGISKWVSSEQAQNG